MDSWLLRVVNVHHWPWLDGFMKWVAAWGHFGPAIGLLLVLAVRGRPVAAQARDGLFAYYFAGTVSEDILKAFIARKRPTAQPWLAQNLHFFGKPASAASLSFPSGTAAISAAVAVWAWLCWGRRAAAPFIALALFLAWGRLYVAAHYPSDIVAGWIVGGLIAWGVLLFGRWAART